MVLNSKHKFVTVKNDLTPPQQPSNQSIWSRADDTMGQQVHAQSNSMVIVALPQVADPHVVHAHDQKERGHNKRTIKVKVKANSCRRKPESNSQSLLSGYAGNSAT